MPCHLELVPSQKDRCYLLPKALSVLAGGVIGVKQTVFNTQELETTSVFWTLDFNLLGYSLGYPMVFTGIFVLSRTLDLDNGFYE